MFIKDNKRRGVMIQGTFRSNFLLFGVPLGLSIGGESGAVLAALSALSYIITEGRVDAAAVGGAPSARSARNGDGDAQSLP